MPENAEKRILWIDALRVFAIVCIIATHVIRAWMEPGESTAMLMVIGSAMLFLMASGALVLPLQGAAWPWLRHRLARVGIPTVIWGLIYLIIYNFTGKYEGFSSPIFWRRLVSIFICQPGSLWFLNLLLGLYLVVPIVSPWIRQASRRQIEIVLAIWLATGFYPIWDINFGLRFAPEMTIVGGFYGFFGYMLMGYYLRRWPIASDTVCQRWITVGVLLALTLVGWIMFDPMLRNGVVRTLTNDLSVNNMAWFSLIFALFTLIRRMPSFAEKAVHILARSTFGAYLVMDLVIGFIALPYFTFTPWLSVPATIVLCFALGFLLRHIPLIGKYIC